LLFPTLGAVRARLGTRARHPARPVDPELIMTKAKTRNRPAAEASEPETAVVAPPPKASRQTKAALLRARLSEPGGVSLAALMEVTGWQAHTLRAALSGLRKGGLTLIRRREGDDTIYAIGSAVAETSLPAKGSS
jgi:Protein of unknown function (DUF3489)